MSSKGGLFLWRLTAALFLAIAALVAFSAVFEPVGTQDKARFAQSPDDAEAPNEDDRPLPDETEGLARAVGEPSEVGVEVLGDQQDQETRDFDDLFEPEDSDEFDSMTPADQVELQPKFTG